MNKRFYIIAATVLLFGLSLAFVVESYAGDQKEISVDQQDDPWKLLQPLVGSWTGTGHGTPGTSRIERQYEFVLGGKFLNVRNKSVFESSTANPEGEVHEDWGMYSYDQRRKTFVLREFHNEGYINQYILKEISDDGNVLVFLTEAVENGPPTLRARLTIKIGKNHQLSETFELDFSGKGFKPCVEAKLTRQ